MARESPKRLFVGVDANASALHQVSGRALRAGVRNVLYVRAAMEDLPAELAGAADRVTVVLPWGSLLAAVARPDPELSRGSAACASRRLSSAASWGSIRNGIAPSVCVSDCRRWIRPT
jgi:hypothetical protein